MTDQSAMQMGLGEPISHKPTFLERFINGWTNLKRTTTENFRTRRWLRAGLVLLILGGVAASSAVVSRTITAAQCVQATPVPKPTSVPAKTKVETRKNNATK